MARHYPNDLLISGFDILFFWDARMLMMGAAMTGQNPWPRLYLHGLVRAADLIGQLADPHYLRKQTALFYEFHEIGAAQKLGYTSAADLSENYPKFFWEKVEPYIGDALRCLRRTMAGKQWVAHLYSNVFTVEHQLRWLGPEPGHNRVAKVDGT